MNFKEKLKGIENMNLPENSQFSHFDADKLTLELIIDYFCKN